MLAPYRGSETPADALISAVESALHRGEGMPLALGFAWERAGAAAWRAATVAYGLRSLLRTLGRPGFGAWGTPWDEVTPRVVCPGWGSCPPECHACLARVRALAPDAPTLAEILEARRGG